MAHFRSDANGTSYLKHFEESGIGTKHIHVAKGVASGAAPIWVEADGQNRIIVVPGANHLLTPEQAVAAVDGCSAARMVVIGQFEIPQPVTAAAFAAAKKRGAAAVTVLNPAPATEAVSAELLSSCDWLIPNESEFALLSTGQPSDASPSDEAILAYGKKVGVRLLVTLGANGVALVSADGNSVQRLPAPTLTEKVIDTTGAGDAFVGAFCHGLASGLAELDAVKLGMACASDSVTREGTQASFPTKQRCQALGIL